MRCDHEIAAEEINFIYVLEVFFAVFPSAPNTPILFLRYYLRPEYTDCFCISQEVSGELLPPRFGVHTKNVIGTLRSSEAGRRGRRPLPRLSPFSAKPKRRPHFGGEGYSRGAKTDPVFAPVRGFNASYEQILFLYILLRPPVIFWTDQRRPKCI